VREGQAQEGEVIRGARQACALFAIAGTIGLVNGFVPGMVGYANDALRLVNLGGLAVAAIGWLIPWDRLGSRSTLAFVVPALALIGTSHMVDGVPPTIYGVWFVVVFAWLGMWHPAGTCVAIGPLAVVAYVLPLALRGDGDAVASVGVAIPAAVLLGEVMARTVAALHAAQRAQAEAAELLAKASVTDDLTGVGNRRHGNRLLDSLEGGDVLAILDLDEFKAVNDRHGHARGDELLCELSSYLAGAVRASDDVARFGGEEFVVVLRGAGGALDEPARRLLDGWRARRPLTSFSAGFAVHVAGTSPASTYAEADAALYAAKRAGRDRVCAAATSAAGEFVPVA
jgi:diguanylate cyclase (GGDEF)-like protein